MARRFLLLPVVILLSSCSDGSKPAFADLQYKVRCRIDTGCVESEIRDVQNLDGENGNVISCTLRELGEGTTFFDFAVHNVADDWSIEARNIQFSTEGGAVLGTAAEFTLSDGPNTFGSDDGKIGANPTDLNEACTPEDLSCSRCENVTRPCRMSALVLVDEPEGKGIEGDLLCLCLPNRADQQITREVTGTGAFDDADPLSADPVSFRFLNCNK